jgi:hypothetical protein
MLADRVRGSPDDAGERGARHSMRVMRWTKSPPKRAGIFGSTASTWLVRASVKSETREECGAGRGVSVLNGQRRVGVLWRLYPNR